MGLDLQQLMKMAKEIDKTKVEPVEAVSKGMRLFLEFWGIILLIITFALDISYWRIVTFIIGGFMYIRGRALGN